jgi:hypothetical protein
LSCISRWFGLCIAATDRTSSEPFDQAQLVGDHHLATYGDLGDQCNFIAIG